MTGERCYLLDVNLLIALSWPQHVHHHRAHAWFAAEGRHRWATTPLTETGFVRISSKSALIPWAVPVAEAVAALAVMRASPGHSFLPDGSSLADPRIETGGLATTNQVTDLHLVNLAAESGAVLATLDSTIPSYLTEPDRAFVALLP